MTDIAATWEEYEFPSWVPEKTRKAIMDFWRVEWGRSPAAWLQSAQASYNHHPQLGAQVECESLTNSGLPRQFGRWVPLWNNIGCVVKADGSVGQSSTCGIRVIEIETAD